MADSAYPIPSAPTTCDPEQSPMIQRRTWRFGEVDPATDVRPRGSRGRITSWCAACGQLLEVQEEHTGAALYSGFPHGRAEQTAGADSRYSAGTTPR
jgi:hypothetical protein